MVIEDVPAWAPHLRSKTPLRKSATRYLVDPSLGVAVLGVGRRQLLGDLNAGGFRFQSLVVRDLSSYSRPLHCALSHWRDNNGHEVDVVVTLDDGRWAALEVKMNRDHIDVAANSLQRFLDKIDTGTRSAHPPSPRWSPHVRPPTGDPAASWCCPSQLSVPDAANPVCDHEPGSRRRRRSSFGIVHYRDTTIINIKITVRSNPPVLAPPPG